MSREPLRFRVPLLLHLPTQTARYKTNTCLQFSVAVLYLSAPRGRPRRLTRTCCVCLLCVCVPVSVGPVCHVALTSFEAVPIPQSAVSRPSPTSSTRPRKVVALVCIRSCALQCFIKTRVWLKASTAAPSDTEKEARYSSLLSLNL